MRRFFVVAVVCLAAFLALRAAGAQSGTGQIRGVVTDGANPVTGAEVKLTSGVIFTRTTRTDAGGQFQFTGLAASRYEISVTMKGFQTLARSVTLSTGATQGFTLALTHLPPGPAQAQDASIASQSSVTAAETVAIAAVPPAAVGGVAGGYVPGLASAPYQMAARMAGPSTPKPTTRSTTTSGRRSRERRSRPSRSTSTPRRTRTSAASSNQAQLPPKDAVRIEELVNYFPYDYPSRTDDAAVRGARRRSASARGTRSTGSCASACRHGASTRSSMPPSNLVFLVDVSGSMSTPNKLPLRQGVAGDARAQPDRPTTASPSSSTPARPGSCCRRRRGGDKTAILDALGRLEAGGSTNGAQGIRARLPASRGEHFIKGGVNRVILATDGDFNVGVTSQGELDPADRGEAQDAASCSSVLGFGMGNLKDSTMEKLADKGNGNYAYIDYAERGAARCSSSRRAARWSPSPRT